MLCRAASDAAALFSARRTWPSIRLCTSCMNHESAPTAYVIHATEHTSDQRRASWAAVGVISHGTRGQETLMLTFQAPAEGSGDPDAHYPTTCNCTQSLAYTAWLSLGITAGLARPMAHTAGLAKLPNWGCRHGHQHAVDMHVDCRVDGSSPKDPCHSPVVV